MDGLLASTCHIERDPALPLSIEKDIVHLSESNYELVGSKEGIVGTSVCEGMLIQTKKC